MITIVQILVGLLLLGLFTAMFYACFGSSKGRLSLLNLKTHLRLLETRLKHKSALNPDEERGIMETLQNKAKTFCSEEAISADADLKALFLATCQSVNATIASIAPVNKSSWLKYGALMNDFNEQYFVAGGERSHSFNRR